MAAKVPDDIDIKAIREKLAPSQAGLALKFGFTLPTPSETGNRGPKSHPFKPAPVSR
jgi:hypothetical protein